MFFVDVMGKWAFMPLILSKKKSVTLNILKLNLKTNKSSNTEVILELEEKVVPNKL